ncbi:MAG: patatin-like phospholipase family protein, partial [Microcoleaceae cyanobacterium]
MAELFFHAVLAEKDLRISPEEKEVIISKMPPPDALGNIYADGVFEGGGIRGLSFLGALRCCHDLGLEWRKLAGTSAGAITAAFLATDLPFETMENTLGAVDYEQIFLAQKSSDLILNGDPADDLQAPWQMLMSLKLAGKLGQYSLETFENWLAQYLVKGGVKTFTDLKNSTNSNKELKVVVSDITYGQMLVLPDDLARPAKNNPGPLSEKLGLSNPDDFSVAQAVRYSMSLPLFFEPGYLDDAVIVDGGLLSNFPLWLYDVKPQNDLDKLNTSIQYPRWFTFGFRCIDQTLSQAQNITGPMNLIGATLRTMLVARDSYHLRAADNNRV